VLVLPSPDGLCTNAYGFMASFEEFQHQDVLIAHCETGKNLEEFEVARITTMMSKTLVGDIDDNTEPRLVDFVDRMVKSSLSKIV
jgi:hypothetical protein